MIIMERNIFREALIKKYRFNYKGSITTEDLFQLRKEDLETIYANLLKEKKEVAETSLFGNNKGNEDLENKIAILEEVAKYRKEAEERKAKELEEREYQKVVKEAIRKKKIEKIEGLSLEELEAMKK